MAFLRYIVPTVAVASGLASAATNTCSAVTTTIQSQSDATALAGCSTFTGSIAIASGTTDSIALDGIKTIQGSLVANNVTQMLSLSAGSLTTIADSFTLESLTVLTTLNFPLLSTVDTIMWTALPALQGLTFGTPGLTEVSSLMIDNTELNSLEGINLETAEVIAVTNNPYLQSINMQLGNVTGSMTIGGNGAKLDAEFPNLEWAYNMTLSNCAQVSIPSLASVNSSIGFFNGAFSSLAAPNLTTVGGSFTVNNCDSVTNVSMPELTTITGALRFDNNSDLLVVDGFPSLKTVGGAIVLNGVFTNVSLPALGTVRGAFNVTSNVDIGSSCAVFKPESGPNNIIQGAYSCVPTTSASSGSKGGSGTSSGSSGSSSGTTSSIANAVLIPGATGLLGVVAAIFGLL